MWFFRRILPTIASSPSSSSRVQKWSRRALFGVGALSVGFAAADYATANSLTRSLRAVSVAVFIVHLYKTTTPTTPEEYSDLHRKAAEAILHLCMRNEGLYIKFGQGFNALNHILPCEYMEVLKALLDNAPSVPLHDIHRIIAEETGKTVEELFLQFDPVPIASASIAQVHRAWLRPLTPSGAPVEVAVKVQKPNIRRQVYFDLETYRLVTTAIGALFDLPVTWARQTVTDGLRRETDFIIEAKNAKRIRDDLAGRPDMYVPKVFMELVTPRLLVMEWIDAVKLVDVETVRREFDHVAVLRTIFNAFGDMIFKFGFVHCDPHAANIMVRRPPADDNRHNNRHNNNTNNSSGGSASALSGARCARPQVVLIDFGLCCPETERFRVEYALLYKSIVTHDITTIERVLASWGVGDAEMFATIQLQKPYEAFRRGSVGEVTPAEVRQMQRDAHSRAQSILSNQEQVPRELSIVGRSIGILHGVNRLYGAPLGRVGVFVRCAVAGLGPIHSYAEAQRYIAQFANGTAVGAVFGAAAEAAAAAEAEARRRAMNMSLWQRVCNAIATVYGRVVFELMLLLLDAQHAAQGFCRWKVPEEALVE